MLERMYMDGRGSGVVVDYSEDYVVGDTYTFEGNDYLIAGIESMLRFTNGDYKSAPLFLILRGFEY